MEECFPPTQNDYLHQSSLNSFPEATLFRRTSSQMSLCSAGNPWKIANRVKRPGVLLLKWQVHLFNVCQDQEKGTNGSKANEAVNNKTRMACQTGPGQQIRGKKHRKLGQLQKSSGIPRGSRNNTLLKEGLLEGSWEARRGSPGKGSLAKKSAKVSQRRAPRRRSDGD